MGPDGIIGKYHKTHCSAVGIDRYVQKGDNDFEVYETRFGRIGLIICYELRFPEIQRILALKGADIIVNITNLACDAGLECHQELLGPTRALENKVYLISASRVGSEGGFTFLGRSQIIDVNGRILVEASQEKEELIQVTIEPEKARDKRVEWMPEQDLFEDRRPELYKNILRKEFVPHKTSKKIIF
jgi:predicted amidohydrolase